jgi:hypothetical protein
MTGSGQMAMPDRASAQVKVTVTGPLYQPLAVLVPLVIAPVMVGAVLSSLTVTASVPTFPAVSVAVPLTGWPAVSVETVTGAVTLATPEPLSSSLAINVTATLLLFQPSALGLGDKLWLTSGAPTEPHARDPRGPAAGEVLVGHAVGEALADPELLRRLPDGDERAGRFSLLPLLPSSWHGHLL